jgi:hypothetical protein
VRTKELAGSLAGLAGVVLICQRSLLHDACTRYTAPPLHGRVRGDLRQLKYEGRLLGMCRDFGIGASAAALLLEQLTAVLVCPVGVSRAGRVSFSWITAGLNVTPTRAVLVSLCKGCWMSPLKVLYRTGAYELQLQPDTLWASMTVLFKPSVCSADVQQTVMPQQAAHRGSSR